MRTSGISVPALFAAVLLSKVRSDIQMLFGPICSGNGAGIVTKNPGCGAFAYGGTSTDAVLFVFTIGQFGKSSQKTVASTGDRFVIHSFVVHCVPKAPGAEPGLIGTRTDRCPDGLAKTDAEVRRRAIASFRIATMVSQLAVTDSRSFCKISRSASACSCCDRFHATSARPNNADRRFLSESWPRLMQTF